MIKAILLILMTIPSFIIGQDEPVDAPMGSVSGLYRWEIGVNGGVNITNVSGFKLDSGATIENNIGRLYGVTVVYHLNKVFAIKTDFDFENKGWTVKNFGVIDNTSGITSLVDVRQNLNYFDIPAFLHIGFGKKLKFDLNFGPYMAFLMDNGTSVVDGNGVEIPNQEDILNTIPLTEYSATDFGITYGAGIDLALGKRFSLGFDFLIEKGLKDITPEGLRNQSIDFDFGINFLFGEKGRKK